MVDGITVVCCKLAKEEIRDVLIDQEKHLNLSYIDKYTWSLMINVSDCLSCNGKNIFNSSAVTSPLASQSTSSNLATINNVSYEWNNVEYILIFVFFIGGRLISAAFAVSDNALPLKLIVTQLCILSIAVNFAIYWIALLPYSIPYPYRTHTVPLTPFRSQCDLAPHPPINRFSPRKITACPRNSTHCAVDWPRPIHNWPLPYSQVGIVDIDHCMCLLYVCVCSITVFSHLSEGNWRFYLYQPSVAEPLVVFSSVYS